MSGAHTPGPWRIGSNCEERGKTWIGGCNEHGGAVLPYIAVINWPDHQDANAHLIAAAPDMLEALEEAVFDYNGPDQDPPQWVSSALAAIARAKGGDA